MAVAELSSATAPRVAWGTAVDAPANAALILELGNPFASSVKRFQLVVTVSSCMSVSLPAAAPQIRDELGQLSSNHPSLTGKRLLAGSVGAYRAF
jgi:hypothetical protein